ncbi:MAG TPA: LysM peptidoglycan-binding domain-containing protein [Candidatus Sulfotelmatobacter sp.]|nr:LysM peptidoglycan-binding domain-containing protein [Candidatus Sulfotelmatobacter sp.]
MASLYVRTGVLVSAILSVCGCQTAQRPVALVPPASAPALKPAPPAAQSAASDPAQSPTQQQDSDPPAQANQAPAAAIPAADPDAVADLVARAEKQYQAGLANYHAGKSDDAKHNFDNALNALLESNFDVRSDHRLEEEFDRIVQGVDDLYPAGTQADNDGSPDSQQDAQQKSEPAPIDETNGFVPAADAKTKAKAEAEIKNTHSDLPLMMTDQVAGYITYFSGRGRGVFERALARSGRYRDMMLPILKEEGVPQDLIYLAQAESGFHTLAVSRAGARGIWQFMASRGRGYGLNHNMWVDDRQDPEKSTRAAARHLKDLYNQFGDWYLAMAAYNSGPGTVQAAVKRTGYADFWELYRRNVLPKETRNYVPIILAVTIMAKNPSQYGLDDVVMDRPAPYDTLAISYPVDLRLVADCVNSTPDQLQDLNPSLLRLSTPREGTFQLHLPAGTKDQYETSVASIPTDMRLSWRYHAIQPGETLASLARSYHTTIKSIEAANHLDGADVEPEAKLVIPVAPGRHGISDTATYAKRITRYKVRRGDTVETVAENFGVSPLMLRRWNGIRGDSLGGRKVLALHVPVSPSARSIEVASNYTSKSKHSAGSSRASRSGAAASKTEIASAKLHPREDDQETAEVTAGRAPALVHHKVKSGETLYSIANLYKTTVAAIERDNRNIAVLRPGMILVVPTQR